ncbi:hypothetical protein N752_09445 [Desulforamulus aquiferis]|nr:hypothetical protein [Desulforamulus aquiferis]RYD05560.1 hypothetical protein N752_09445 [Desulforamulus aquiferis]
MFNYNPWDDNCLKILKDARSSPFPGSYLRSLQRYSVQVFEKEFIELNELGILESINGRLFVLKEEMLEGHYSKETGLIPKTESMLLNDTLII